VDYQYCAGLLRGPWQTVETSTDQSASAGLHLVVPQPAAARTADFRLQLAASLSGRLGGAFFFKRGHTTRGNGQRLFSAIAYQLALNVEWLRSPISQVVEHNLSVLARSIRTQMRKLISQPSCDLNQREPILILIDGLDECEGHDFQEAILRVIGNSSSKDTLPFRFILASRPELHIREVFHFSYFDRHRSFNVEQSFHDVRKYLRHEFARIHRTRDTMKETPRPWPADDVLEELVEKSSGHFIYATIILMMKTTGQRSGWQLCKTRTARAPSRHLTHSTALYDYPQFCSEEVRAHSDPGCNCELQDGPRGN